MFERMPTAETETKREQFLKGAESAIQEAFASAKIDAERKRVLLEEAEHLADLIGPENDATLWVQRFAQATLTENGHTDDEPE
ncbi:MAG: hypothetical protein WCJ25_03390 [Candidatus Moraniibacteriota bacterium]